MQSPKWAKTRSEGPKIPHYTPDSSTAKEEETVMCGEEDEDREVQISECWSLILQGGLCPSIGWPQQRIVRGTRGTIAGSSYFPSCPG